MRDRASTAAPVMGWQRMRTPLIWIAALLAVVAILLAAAAAVQDPARSEPSNAIVTAKVDGREIAVVVYRTDTFGRLDLFRIDSVGFSTQAEAFDLDTGARVWDTLLFAEFGGTEAQVLGMGSKYVHVATAKGLVILDAATGAIVAREGEIEGLGDEYVAALDAYAWDTESQAVVLLSATGAVLSIPVDAREASSAPADVVARWSDELGIESDARSVFSPADWEQRDNWAPIPGGDQVDPVWAAEGWDVDVLLEGDTGLAAGWADGFAVTQTYQPDSSEAYYLFQVGDLATGRLIGTVEGEDGASSVTVTAEGRVVMLSRSDDYRGLLIVATSDGIRSSIIGERAFLGW